MNRTCTVVTIMILCMSVDALGGELLRESFSTYKDKRVEELQQLIVGAGPNARQYAAEALGSKSAEVLPSIRKMLKDNNWKVRRAATVALQKMKDEGKELIPDLIIALKDKEYWVRHGAACALVDMGKTASTAIPALIEAFRKEETIWVRWRIIDTGNSKFAAMTDDQEVLVEMALMAIADPDSNVCAAALSMMRKIEDKKLLLPSLIKALILREDGMRGNVDNILRTIASLEKEGNGAYDIVAELCKHPVPFTPARWDRTKALDCLIRIMLPKDKEKTVKLLTHIARADMNKKAADKAAAELEKLGVKLPPNTKPVKIYILAGQSNMEGGEGDTRKLDPKEWYLRVPRRDISITQVGRPTGPLKPGYGGGYGNFGPELTFGDVLGDALDTDAFFIKFAVGGTSQAIRWRAPSSVRERGGKVGDLYNHLIRRVHSLLANFEEVYPASKGRGFEVAALLWLQGESDSGNPTEYKDNLFDFIKDVRCDLGIAKLPFIMAKINDSVLWDGSLSPHAPKDKNGNPKGASKPSGGPVIRAAQQAAADTLENVTAFETKDLHPGFHYDSASIAEIGRRFGRAALEIKDLVADQSMDAIAEARAYFLERTEATPVANPDTTSLAQGLIGYWKFDEKQGKVVQDSSSKGFHGEIQGSAVWTKGLLGGGLKLKGEQRVVVPAFQETRNEDGLIENLSISYWINTPLAKGMNRIGKGVGHPWDWRVPDWGDQWYLSPMANDGGWDMSNCDNSGIVHFTAYVEDIAREDLTGSWQTGYVKGTCTHQKGSIPLQSGDGYEWHHIVGVFDGTERTMKCYIDGVPAMHYRKHLTGYIRPVRDFLTFGGYLSHISDFQVFDEVAIWERPLSETEIKTLCNNGGGAEIEQ